MRLHLLNRQHLDQAKVRFAPYHDFGSALRRPARRTILRMFLLLHWILWAGGLLPSNPLNNAGLLRLRRLQRHHILIELFRRTAK